MNDLKVVPAVPDRLEEMLAILDDIRDQVTAGEVKALAVATYEKAEGELPLLGARFSGEFSQLAAAIHGMDFTVMTMGLEED